MTNKDYVMGLSDEELAGLLNNNRVWNVSRLWLHKMYYKVARDINKTKKGD